MSVEIIRSRICDITQGYNILRYDLVIDGYGCMNTNVMAYAAKYEYELDVENTKKLINNYIRKDINTTYKIPIMTDTKVIASFDKEILEYEKKQYKMEMKMRKIEEMFA